MSVAFSPVNTMGLNGSHGTTRAFLSFASAFIVNWPEMYTRIYRLT